MFKNIQKLFNTGLHDINPGLERIKKFLEVNGSPHDTPDYILVGGTNGKYSVATIIATILHKSGHKTGLYTSPHLVDVTERFKIDGFEIGTKRLDDILGYIFRSCERHNISLSFFELATATAFIYFQEESIDIGVLEVGMGGRWDATNVVDPLVSIITNVSYDHMNFLGNTLHEIASEKAEIIKSKGLAVTGATDVSLDVIRKKAADRECKLFILDKDFSSRLISSGRFDYVGVYKQYLELNTKLKGFHQINNIALSICCIELLIYYFKYSINEDIIRTSVDNLSIEGRLEYLREKPPLIIDGAHNESAAQALVRSLKHLHGDKKFVFLIAMLTDKDHAGYIKQLAPLASKIIITQIPDTRCMKAFDLYNKVSKIHNNIEVIEDPLYALETLIEHKEASIITGSLYLVGFLKGRLKNEQNRLGI